MAEPFVLSASSLNTYLRCAKQWELLYVLGIRGKPSLRASRGIAVHRAVEVNMRQKIQSKTDLPFTDVLDAFSDSYDEETADGYEAREGETLGSVKDDGYKLTDLHHTQVAPKIQPVFVEEPISFDINGQVWTGQIDIGEEVPTNLWGEEETGILVRDTKTASRRPSPEQYAINMTGYALGTRVSTGKREAGVVFDYLVATQKPYYEKIEQPPISDEGVRSFAYLVGNVTDSIKKGAFPANGLTSPGVCDWCGVRAQCPAYRAKNPNV